METPSDVKRDAHSRLQNTSISNTIRWIYEAILILASVTATNYVVTQELKERVKRLEGK